MSKKFKILFFVQLPPPVHGVSVTNLHAVNNPLWKNNFQTETLKLDFGQTLDNIGKVTFLKVIRMFFFTFRLIYTLAKFRPHLVYFTIMPVGKIFYRDALFTVIIKLFRCKVIFHLHGKGINETAQKSAFRKWVYKRTFRNSSVICLSPLLAKDINTIYQPAPYILPNGIEIANTGKKKNETDIPIILFLSNLIKEKGIEVLLESAANLYKQGYKFRIRIIGAEVNYTYKNINDFCNNNNLSDVVEICGPKFGDEKRKELLNASFMVLPSYNECMPLVILEAMQAGLPVVVSRVGGIPDVINGETNGLLVTPGNVPDLTTKIKLLLDDKSRREELARNARADFYRLYTLQRFNENLYKIIENTFANQNKKQ